MLIVLLAATCEASARIRSAESGGRSSPWSAVMGFVSLGSTLSEVLGVAVVLVVLYMVGNKDELEKREEVVPVDR
jgi:hypothetical protein